jgi:HlyD family secretion protein
VYASFPAAQRTTPAAVTAKAQRDTARAAIATAEAQYNLVAAGSRSQQVAAAAATLDAAKAQLTAAKTQVDAASAQVVAAKAQVDGANASLAAANAQETAAEAGLAVVDAQIARLSIASPLGGTVLSRTIEPGEAVTPGTQLLQVADLGHLTLTVYVPEDRYGAITLGQKVDVTVDSFPGQVFTGSVSRIANQAEFTPRNVQTVDGRKSTVFAIQLALDPTSSLKPGMPADVTFR